MLSTGEKVTTALAVWGAVVSTIALTWNIVRDLRDKTKIKVSASHAITFGGFGLGQDLFSVEAVNVGRRPVQLVEVACVTDRMPPGTKTIFTVLRRLPLVLNESEQVTEYVELSALPSGRFTSIYMKDATGRKWSASRKNRRALNKGR